MGFGAGHFGPFGVTARWTSECDLTFLRTRTRSSAIPEAKLRPRRGTVWRVVIPFRLRTKPRKPVADSLSPSDVFAELLRPHLPALYRLAYRLTGRQHEAEDLLQELLTRLYARSEKLDAVESLRPWLARALYNLFIDERRRWAHNPLKHASDPDDGNCTLKSHERSGNPEFHTEMSLLTQNLEELLAQLPEEQRAVVLLKDVEGYELHETASILGIALGTAKSRLHRAHLQLQKALQQRNLFLSNVVLTDEPSDLSAAMSGIGVADNEV